MFIDNEDYRVVIGDAALKVVSQSSPENIANAEAEAIEEISGYLRPVYDTGAIFAATGGDRNRLIVMYTADIVLYHSLPRSRRRWAARFARSAMSALSDGSRACRPAGLSPTFLLSCPVTAARIRHFLSFTPQTETRLVTMGRRQNRPKLGRAQKDARSRIQKQSSVILELHRYAEFFSKTTSRTGAGHGRAR